MLVVLAEAPKVLFYSPKGPRSHCSSIWKAMIAFCLRAYHTFRWRTRHVRYPFPPIACWHGADVFGVDHVTDRCAAWELFAAKRIRRVRCTPNCLVNYSQHVSVNSQEQPVSQLTRPGSGHVWCTQDCPVRSSLAQLCPLSSQTS
jgi:hypothetical protein